jgi:molybdenum cofactor cytidylyltransferase
MIRALVLAAGESTRMGVPKALLRIDDTTFLGRILSNLRQAALGGITVVLGAHAQLIQARTDFAGVEVVVHPGYRDGQLSSLCAGVRSLAPETEAFVLCLVDNPFVTSTLVNQVVEAFHRSGQSIVVPVHAGKSGHPTLFARAVFAELLAAPADMGARYVVHADGQRVHRLAVDDAAVLAKIDTPEDYVRWFGEPPR